MEGLQETNLQFGKETFTNELQQLEKHLETRISSEKSTPVIPITGFRWWKVAAAAVVVIVAGVFAYNSYFSPTEKSETPIALIDKSENYSPEINSTKDSITTVIDTTAKGSATLPTEIPL
ncbi:MAG: hypothetical protein IPP79_24435 [Chitinophagaceae bacterium]|nr:hypothetical protein [Chitinophagaceae bacterium]